MVHGYASRKSSPDHSDNKQCEIRNSHASSKLLDGSPEIQKAVKKEKWSPDFMVKGRNEPCTISRVAHVVAKVKDMPVEELAEMYDEKVCHAER